MILRNILFLCEYEIVIMDDYKVYCKHRQQQDVELKLHEMHYRTCTLQ